MGSILITTSRNGNVLTMTDSSRDEGQQKQGQQQGKYTGKMDNASMDG